MGGLSAFNEGLTTGEDLNGVPDGRRILYDESGILVFNHPSDSSIAAHHDVNDRDPDDHQDYIKELETLGQMTEEEFHALSIEGMATHAQYVNKLLDEKREIEELMRGYDPYTEGIRILDTDYDNYMMFYHCTQNEP